MSGVFWQLPTAAANLQPSREPKIRVDGRELVNLCLEGHLALEHGSAGDGVAQQAQEQIASFKRAVTATLFAELDDALEVAIRALGGASAMVLADACTREAVLAACARAAATVITYRHRDVAHARELLGASSGARVLVTEGVFGADGTVAPLQELSAAAQACGARLLLEDTYGFGVLGPHGVGTARHFGPEHALALDAEVAGFQGALGLPGAFVVSAEPADPAEPADRAAVGVSRLVAALEHMDRDDGPQDTVWARTRYLREGLNAFDLDTGDTHSPITPVLCGTPERAMACADRLFEAGVLVHVVPKPIFAGGQAALRCTVGAAHTEDDLERAIEVMAEVLT